MIFLLDVNVLIALIDPAHIDHDTAHHWFAAEGQAGWATCPITQNGALRIVGHPRYPNTPGSPAAVAKVLAGMCALPGHHFWGDDISLLAGPPFDPAKVLTSAQVTDTYLLGLAAAHGGRLATFDSRLSFAAVRGGKAVLRVLRA